MQIAAMGCVGRLLLPSPSNHREPSPVDGNMDRGSFSRLMLDVMPTTLTSRKLPLEKQAMSLTFPLAFRNFILALVFGFIVSDASNPIYARRSQLRQLPVGGI